MLVMSGISIPRYVVPGFIVDRRLRFRGIKFLYSVDSDNLSLLNSKYFQLLKCKFQSPIYDLYTHSVFWLDDNLKACNHQLMM